MMDDLLTNWRPVPYSSIVGTGVCGPGGVVICTVPGPKESAEPIVRLIAAAPELLAILQEFEMYSGAMEYDDWHNLVERARDVIAKAEGRS